jgi:hypothetical protein
MEVGGPGLDDDIEVFIDHDALVRCVFGHGSILPAHAGDADDFLRGWRAIAASICTY